VNGIADGQVIVAPTAAERRRVQPLVTFEANGGKRAEIRVGQQARRSPWVARNCFTCG